MIRRVLNLTGVILLVAAACTNPGTDALHDDPLAEAMAEDDGNAGEPGRPGAAALETSSCGSGANGGFHYCSAACPCDAGEGDCDSNGECAPGLTCVKDAGPNYGWDHDVDVCEDTCHPSANGGFHYCSASCPCAAGEGDCDSNSECLPGLTCVKDVGPRYGWDSDVDVCEGRCDDAGDECRPGCPCEPADSSLFLQVLALDGQPIPLAAVTTVGIPQPTDGAGRILLEDLPPGRFVARVEAHGFAPASLAVDLPAGAHGGAEVRLRPLGAPIPFQAETGATIKQPAARVTIPPGALVDHLGQPVTGTVEATVVPLEPREATSDTLPGPLQGLAAGTGAAVDLESVVMAEVSLWQKGMPVQLAPGARATLELPLPDAIAGQYQIGESIPAWWLDLDAGIWREEGAGTIQQSSSEPGKLVWVVEVGHFTWWNCDFPWTDKHCFTVTVQDASGSPVRDIQVSAQGVSYTGASRSSYTGGSGQACVEIMRDGTADILVGSPSAPMATQRVTGVGPAADCAGSAACTSVTVTLPPGTAICTPGSTELCSPYSGPAGTEGVGVCQAGASQCNATGTGWSGCVGEVRPSPETCTSIFDEDCDGEADDGLDCSGCSIGERIDCYSGPPATLNVGLCRAGTRTCGFSRMFGPCTGEVLPQVETCETPGDDNCDGSTACAGMTLWSRRFGGTGHDHGSRIAVDSAGNMLLTGTFQSAVDFGGGPLSSAGTWDIFLVKLDTQGQHLWGRRFGGTGFDAGIDVEVDSAGNILLTGSFQDTVDFGGGPLSSAGQLDIFVVKLDPEGQHMWSQGFGGTSDDYGNDIELDSAGNVLLSGSFRDMVDFGGGPLPSAGGNDIVALKLDAQGQHIWSRRFGGVDSDAGGSITVDSAGNALLTGGTTSDTIDFGGGPLTMLSPYNIFVVKLDGQGQHQWSRLFGETSGGLFFSSGIAVDSTDSVLLTGQVSGTIDFGGGPLSSLGSDDVFAVKIDDQGQHVWSRRFGGTIEELGRDITVDGADNVLLTGEFFSSTVSFGGDPLSRVGERDMFMVKLDAQGQHVWSRRLGGASYLFDADIEVNSAGNILLTGSFTDTADFGAGPHSSAGEVDIFVVSLNP